MQIEFALLADSVAFSPDGKLNIHGAGIDTIIAPVVPAQHPLIMVVVRVLLSRPEAAAGHYLGIVLRGPDEAILGGADVRTQPIPEDVRIRVPPRGKIGLGLVLGMENVVFPVHGTYQIAVRWDNREVRSLRLTVVEPVAQA